MFSNNFKKVLIGVIAVTAFSVTAMALSGNLPFTKAGGDSSMSSSISNIAVVATTVKPNQDISSSEVSSEAPVASQVSTAETSQVQSTVAADSSTGAIVLPAHGATIGYYAVINPDTGDFVMTTDTNYTTCKAELGGDAGTVDPNKSTTIAAARVKIAAAKAAAKAALSSSATGSSSTAS